MPQGSQGCLDIDQFSDRLDRLISRKALMRQAKENARIDIRELPVNLRPLAVWLMIIFAECVHGLLRELFLEVAFGDRVTHQVGVAVGSMLVIGIAIATARWMQVATTGWLLVVGALWVSLTFAFDVVLGRVFIDSSFERVLADYDPRRGGLMLLGMAVLALAPLLAAKLRGIRDDRAVI